MSFLTTIPRRAGADAGDLHRDTMALFGTIDAPEDQRRAAINVLWRAGTTQILVRSDIAPANLPPGAKSVTEQVREIPAGEQVPFMLVVDAVRRGRDSRGRITTSRVTDDELAEWLAARLAPALTDVRVRMAAPAESTSRKGAGLNPVAILGEATVADVAALAELLRCGVGRSKAFGCGLLTIA